MSRRADLREVCDSESGILVEVLRLDEALEQVPAHGGWRDGRWWVVDATTLAPRGSLVRIATGRDASDTAFLTVQSGRADLVSMRVDATASPDLPRDDLTSLVSLT